MTSIEKMFVDPDFRSSSGKGYPNRLYGNSKKKIGAIAVVRGRGNDFALSVAGLNYVAEAEAEGRVKEGYVVLAQLNGGATPEFIAAERVTKVAERLRDVTPSNGKWGEYHWITETFQPVLQDDSAPF
jgi:hypothetical protein